MCVLADRTQKKREADRRANRLILGRTVFLMVLFGVIIFIPLLVKLWNIQITQHDYYLNLAIGQQTRDITVNASRGTIYDAKGTVLAISASAQTVILSPKDVVELQASYAEAVAQAREKGTEFPSYPEPTNEFIASNLAAILDVDEDKILGQLAKTTRQYEVVKAKIEEDTAAQVLTFIVDNHLSQGLYLEPDTKRYYPKSTLASHVIGFVNSENTGAYGLESKYNEELSGQAGRVVTAKNARGTEMLSHYENYIDSVDGNDLHLTLDATIQAMLESALAEGIETYDVQNGGFAIAMDPKTGAIKGMASSPEYDLNNYSAIADLAAAAQLEQMRNDPAVTDDMYNEALQKARLNQWRSKALNDTYEPGSTFKAIVLAAALEEGVVSASDTFTCTGSVDVADRNINCSKKTGHGSQSLAKAVENSCNPAFIAIGQRLGAEKFYDYLEDFNLIGTTGIDIPGEAGNAALVWPRSDFTAPTGLTSLATASFGQRFQITPIQLITAFAATINGGHLMEPYVVDYTTDEDGNVLYQHQVTEIRQVVSEATSQQVRTILEGVVAGGTGRNAYMAGYRIGGKTGTSETSILTPERNIVSFVGFAPADDPQIIVLLAYDWPLKVEGTDVTADGHYVSGGYMAAPMAGQLIANILDYMGVQKQYTQEEMSGVDTMVPALAGRSAADAQGLLAGSGLTCRTVGDGETVTGQIPAAGAYIPKNSQVVLYLGEELPTGQVEVPDVVGLSPQEAQTALSNAGLYIRATGAVEFFTASNRAISQSILPGTPVNRGTVIEVRFMDSSVIDYSGPVIGN